MDVTAFDVPVPFALAATEDAVWATSSEGILRIDIATNQTSLVELPAEPMQLSSVAADETAVWAVDFAASLIHRIDPATGVVTDTIRGVQGPKAVYLADDLLYVPQSSSTAVIDPRTKQQVRSLPIAGPYAFGSVWGALPGSVRRVDPETGELEAAIRVPADAAACTLWPLSGVDDMNDSIVAGCFEGQTLTRVDADTNAHAGTLDLATNGGTAIAVAGGWWSPIEGPLSGHLARIDPRTAEVVEVISLGQGNGPAGMVVTEDALWIAAEASGQVLRVPIAELGGS